LYIGGGHHRWVRYRLLLAAGLAGHALPAAAPVVPGLGWALGIPMRLAAGSGVALTFDDGPHPDGTPAALTALSRGGAPATFFLVGEQVERYPGLAAEIVSAGHEVALHCHRHRNQLRLTPSAIAEDMRRGEEVIAEACGRAPRLYRPPYGIFSAAGLILARRRYEPLLWTRWGRDWSERATVGSIVAKATGRIAAGDVILLHEADHYSDPGSWRNTIGALPGILDALAAAGHSPVAVPPPP
jgi:peptidoglycan/xylan/chitin deacetylase (PgdA/CDA1 family)